MAKKKRKKPKPGPKPDCIVIDNDWKNAIKAAIQMKKPAECWPDKGKKKS